MNKEKKYMGLYTFTYMAIGVMVPLISQYLKSIDFSGTEIGTVTATGTCVAIFASAFWGRIYGTVKSKHLMVMSLCLLASLVAIILLNVSAFPIFIVLFGVMYFFQAPVMSLSDALSIDDEQPFGIVRMFGAVGFALGVFVAARVSETAGLKWIFPMYCISYVIAGVVIFSIYAVDKKGTRKLQNQDDASLHIKKKRKKCVKENGYKELFANKQYLKLILCAFFLCGTNVANNTYFSFLYIEGGGALAGVGIAFLLMAGSEAPIMAWTGPLSRKISAEKLILIAMIISVLRFAWYATGPTNGMLLALFALQGIVNGIILVEFVRYAARLVAESLQGIAIATYYSFSSSSSTILCQIIGGVLLDNFGARGVYMFFSIFNLVGLMLYLNFGLYKTKQGSRCVR